MLIDPHKHIWIELIGIVHCSICGIIKKRNKSKEDLDAFERLFSICATEEKEATTNELLKTTKLVVKDKTVK